MSPAKKRYLAWAVFALLTVALPLQPEPPVLVPEVAERGRDPAIEAAAVADLPARDLAS